MHAARNIQLCTKDCICLFVCPTKATDTETGQIDFSKCLDGCRLCVDACPSHAIYLVNTNYAESKSKSQNVSEKALDLLDRKAVEETKIQKALLSVSGSATGDETLTLILKALKKSLRIVAEDAAREAAYMVPQSLSTQELIENLLRDHPQSGKEPFPKQELQNVQKALGIS